MILILLVTFYAVASGLFSGWRMLVRNRRATPEDRVGALPREPLGRMADEPGRETNLGIDLSWQTPPSPAWRVDPLIFTGLSLHGAGVLVLGLLELWVTLVVWGQKGNWFVRGRDALALFLMLSLLILSWDFIGHILAQPLLGLLKVPANFAVGPLGLFYGATLQPWGKFSHFSRDVVHHEIYLHSAHCPGLVTYSLCPPERAVYEQLVKLMPAYLPSQPPVGRPGAWGNTSSGCCC